MVKETKMLMYLCCRDLKKNHAGITESLQFLNDICFHVKGTQIFSMYLKVFFPALLGLLHINL